MTFSFETDVLPVLIDMANDPAEQNYPLMARVRELTGETDPHRIARRLEQMKESGYVEYTSSTTGDGRLAYVIDARITVKGLQQLDLWPSDNERALYLAGRMSQSFEEMANTLAATPGSDPEEVSKLRTTAKGMLQFGGAVFAQVLATTITG